MAKRWIRPSIALLILAFTPVPAAHAAQKRAFAWRDLFSMIRLDDPRPSPDGKWVLVGQREMDIEGNKSDADLVVYPAEGEGAAQKIAADKAQEGNGRWLPDGTAIVFLSSRSGNSQVWKAPFPEGAPKQMTSLPVDVDGFELSPDGRTILFWAGVFPDCRDLACTAERLKKADASPVKARVFDRTFIRHWDTWNDGRRNHLFILPLEGGQPPRDLLSGLDQDAPTKPFGGSEEIAWSPDSKTIAFSSKPSPGEAWSTNSEIYLVAADGKAKPRAITSANPALDTAPVFSPDGKWLAYLAMDRPGYEADRQHIVLWDTKAQTRRELKDWDRSPSALLWAADNATLYAEAADEGRNRIFSVDVASGEVKPLVTDGHNSALRLTRLGKLMFLRDRLVHPAEVFSFNPANGKTTQVTTVNEPLLSKLALSQPEEFWFTNDGLRMQGWIMLPPQARKGQKVPVAFLIHGGPQQDFGDHFHYRWNPQFYTGAGYAAVMVNFRGSTGFGQKLTDAIRGNWGPGPYSDLLAGLEAALKQRPELDRQRMCALGASYGGYQINWIAGQDHPFRCLVSHSGMFDTTAAYYNTEELWFPEWEFEGTPWDKKEIYERHSPMQRVNRWKTPMLVIHGARDFRVAETEAISAFNALQRRGIPSRLLYFPDENHWIQKPLNSRMWHETVLDWLDRWTRARRAPGSK